MLIVIREFWGLGCDEPFTEGFVFDKEDSDLKRRLAENGLTFLDYTTTLIERGLVENKAKDKA